MDTIEQLKNKTKRMLDNKYFQAWMNRYSFDGLDRKQRRFLMKKFYNDGTCSCGIEKHTNELFFCGYQTQKYDIYYEPEVIRFTPLIADSFIDNQPHTVNVDCAVGWANSTRNSIKTICDYFVEKMVGLELIFSNNVLLQNMPFFVGLTPESEMKAKDMISRLMRGECVVFGDIKDLQAIQALVTNAPYIADKLRALYYDYENQLYTILGIDNNKQDAANKYFKLTEEVDSNIAEINLYGNDIDTSIQDFIDDINATFGKTIVMTSNLKAADSNYDKTEETTEEEPDDGPNNPIN